jgi:hypothetical protein
MHCVKSLTASSRRMRVNDWATIQRLAPLPHATELPPPLSNPHPFDFPDPRVTRPPLHARERECFRDPPQTESVAEPKLGIPMFTETEL